MMKVEYVIRNLVSLVIWYRQYGSVAELIFFFIISKIGRRRWVSLSDSTYCNRCTFGAETTRGYQLPIFQDCA